MDADRVTSEVAIIANSVQANAAEEIEREIRALATPARGEAFPFIRAHTDCGGDIVAQPSKDGSAWERDVCKKCGASWFNDPPKPWPAKAQP